MSFRKFFTRKPISELMDEVKNSHDLVRTLGPLQLILLGIGAIIGAGIFVLAGSAASHNAGPAITISLALCGVACACAGLCYAELASTIPVSGGPYTYAYAAMGEVIAWLVMSMMLLTYVLGAATVASGWSGYMNSFLSSYDIHIPTILSHHYGYIATLSNGSKVKCLIDLPAFCIVWLMGSVVYFGANASAMINAIIVVIKMTVIASFIVIGAMYIDPQNWVPFIPENTGKFGEFGLSGIVGGAGAVLLAFTGFDALATAAQETKNPQRDLPIGILGSLFICTIVYILVAGVLTGVANYTELGVSEPMAIAADKMNMPWFSVFIKIGAIAGLTSVILVLIYGIVRALYAVTHDGLLPMWLASIHKKYQTPHVLTLIAVLVISLFGSVIDVDRLARMANLGSLTTFIMVCLSVLCLRQKEPDLVRGFSCPLVPIIPLFGIGLFLMIIIGLPNEIILYGLIWIAFMLLVYAFYGRHNSKLQKEIETGVIEEQVFTE